MAEAFCRKQVAEKLNCSVDEIQSRGYKIASAGLMASSVMPASAEVISICGQKGIDVSRHQSRPFTSAEAELSDYIFVMSESHRKGILEICPAVSGKCFLLDRENEITDPIGLGDDVYRRCAIQIEKALVKRMDEILQ
jgi:protein-tyrosine-phosphatase